MAFPQYASYETGLTEYLCIGLEGAENIETAMIVTHYTLGFGSYNVILLTSGDSRGGTGPPVKAKPGIRVYINIL